MATQPNQPSSASYIRWEEFKDKLSLGLAAFVAGLRTELLHAPRASVSGSHSALQAEPRGGALVETTEAGVVGELTLDGLLDGTEHAARELLLNLDEDNAKVRLYHGFARVQGRLSMRRHCARGSVWRA